MIPKLENYKKFVGEEDIEKIRSSAEKLAVSDVHIVHVNSSSSGGGVAEILNSHILLMNELGIETGWRLLKGTHSFFTITKQFHNSLQGGPLKLTDGKKKIYLDEIERNSIMNHFKYHDLIIIHDPQPLALIHRYWKRQPWIWRCHVDLSAPCPAMWKFLLQYIKRYDKIIVSMKKYKKRGLKIPQTIIAPAIDPFSLKNKHLFHSRCKRMLSRNGIDIDKPLICQVSRFDKWKNPLGVVKIFRKVKQEIKDCHLVLIGDISVDDPESSRIYSKLMDYIKKEEDIHVISKKADLLVNALQRKSDVILQNSVREGFGLTITEALWKETPVVATNVGGIPLQVLDGKTGFLIKTNTEAAKRCIQLLKNPDLRRKLGKQGKEHVKKNFLITKHLQDHINVCNEVLFERMR